MTEESNPTPQAPPQAISFKDWTPRDWFWAAVLVLSLLIGFGMTAFAPI